MTDLPTHVEIHEEGPREGFQIEPGPISTADKIRLIEALAETGLRHIQVCSFVNPRLVPGWADAEAVVGGFNAKPGLDYTALWFNAAGLKRALAFRDKLTDHRLHLAVRLRSLHAEEPEPQPCRERRGDAQADRPASRARRAGEPHRRDGRVRLQLPGRHRARAGRPHARGRARHRRRGRRRDHLVLARRHDGLGDAGAHRARARRGARALAADAARRCTCTTRAAWPWPTRMPACASA